MKRATVAGMTMLITSFVHAGSLPETNWGKERLWNDGRAEVAIYDAERVVYGKPRKFQEQLIIVKEDLRADTLVKADNLKAQKTIRAFKLNQVQKFETENYPYSYMTSVFVKESPVREVVKITVGSQEWCGNTFKSYSADAGAPGGRLRWDSYFDGEAEGEAPIVLAENDYFDDQLPLSLRALPFKEGYQAKIRVWENLTTNRGTAPAPAAAVVTVVGEELVRCRAGSLLSWKVTLEKPDGTDTYWFEKAAPHILTKMECKDGRKRLLFGRARWSYWDRRLPRPNVLN